MRVCVRAAPIFRLCVRAPLVSLYNSDDEADGIAIAPPGHQRRQAAPDAETFGVLVRVEVEHEHQGTPLHHEQLGFLVVRPRGQGLISLRRRPSEPVQGRDAADGGHSAS